jgi:hypothetical protein
MLRQILLLRALPRLPRLPRAQLLQLQWTLQPHGRGTDLS